MLLATASCLSDLLAIGILCHALRQSEGNDAKIWTAKIFGKEKGMRR